MVIHFDTRALAEQKLQADGFRVIKNGAYVSGTGEVSASIHPVHKGDAVAVFYREISAA